MGHGAVLGLVLLAAGCPQQNNNSNNNNSGSDSGPPVAEVRVGSRGGVVQLSGVRLTIPAGALAQDVTLTLRTSPESVPADFTAVSPRFRFGPDGTTFAVPAIVRFTVDSNAGGPVVFWSNSAGGFDPLATTQAAGAVEASVTHLSDGFVAAPYADAGIVDSGPADAGVIACELPHEVLACGRGVSDGGRPTCDCPDRCDGKLFRVSCDGVTCRCIVDGTTTATFPDENICLTGITAALRFCQGLGSLPDAGPRTDAGTRTDAGAAIADAGTTVTDAGSPVTDAGTTTTDAGGMTADGGSTTPTDAGARD